LHKAKLDRTLAELRAHEERKEKLYAVLQKHEGLREKLERVRLVEAKLDTAKANLGAARQEQAQQVRRYAHQLVLPLLEEELEKGSTTLKTLDSHRTSQDRHKYVTEFLNKVESSENGLSASLPNLRKALDKHFPAPKAAMSLAELPRLQVAVSGLEEKIRFIKSAEPASISDRMKTERAQVAKLESELRELRKTLSGAEEEGATGAQSELESVNQQIGAAQSGVDGLRNDLRVSEENLAEKKRELSHAAAGSRAEQLNRKIEQVQKLRSAFEAVLDRVRNAKRFSIEKHATDLMLRLVRKNEVYSKLRINSD